LADKLGCEFALIHKDRKHNTAGGDAMLLVGDVKDKICIMLDDIADTCTTITKAARVLMDHGATRTAAIVTHGILSGDAVERIKSSALHELIVSNTVPQDEHKAQLGDKLKVFDVGPLFAEAIRRTHNGESLSLLFQNMKH
jgi:ribose-phosphate pyrophosphokinase